VKCTKSKDDRRTKSKDKTKSRNQKTISKEEIKRRNQKTKSKDKTKGRNQRTKSKDEGQNQRTKSKDEIKGQNQRTKSKDISKDIIKGHNQTKDKIKGRNQRTKSKDKINFVLSILFRAFHIIFIFSRISYNYIRFFCTFHAISFWSIVPRHSFPVDHFLYIFIGKICLYSMKCANIFTLIRDIFFE